MIYHSSFNNTFLSSLLDNASLTSGFTTREAGDGRNIDTVISNLRINQVIFKKLVVAEQIHSANVERYESHDNQIVEVVPETDGIVTAEKGVLVMVRTADCIPILYADIGTGIIAVSHNGWRGTLKRISAKIIDTMTEQGAKREQIIAAIGPGIGLCCYDIDEERYYTFMEEFESDLGAFSIRGGRRHLNLSKMNFEILKMSGVKAEHIDFFPFCTSCNKNTFFSYRRNHKKHPEQFGEMFSYIVRN
jgi:YfiH family protein